MLCSRAISHGPAVPGRTKCRRCAAADVEQTTEWRFWRILAGLCADCGRPRGRNGTATYCRPHQDRANERSERSRRRWRNRK